jgi:ATP-dependent Lhr-like helicase
MTMNSRRSSSEQSSSSFDRLDERIRRFIWQKQWEALKDAQERAIPVLLEAAQDVIIMAGTASGKTEAAFLPILTRLARSDNPGLAVYVSPLKALINDQWTRLTELCEHLEVPVTPWHGDVSAVRKKRFERNACGCLLITPESLEGLLIRHGHSLATLFARLQYIVIDELHAFLENERGKQLQSQMHRIETALGRRIIRVGLSATLGDRKIAQAFLRTQDSSSVEVIEGQDGETHLKVLLKGYRSSLDASPAETQEPDKEGEKRRGKDEEEEREEAEGDGGLFAIAEDLYLLRGHKNLIFPNSRPRVEQVADLLRRKCEREDVPNEFWPHHGSLSRDIREDAERALKRKDRPATAIATTTLELGIDIGEVERVAQIGPAPSVASLRQRIGRSGRRPGNPAILQAYVIESPLTINSSLSDQLREGLLQSAAQIRLLLRKWCEPATSGDLHLSTLVQQVLALIAQNGGMMAGDAWRTLCVSGVFPGLTAEEFGSLLKELGSRDILQQESSGQLLLGVQGEKLVNHYSFFAAFVSNEEYRIITKSSALGTLPLFQPLVPGSYVIFAGQRWRVLTCDSKDKVIEVEPARSGKVPLFDGTGGEVHDEVRSNMRELLEEPATVTFLDKAAQSLLDEARESYRRLDLDARQVIASGKEVRILTWRGDRVNDTLAIWLIKLGFSASNEGLSIGVFDTEIEKVIAALRQISEEPAPSETELAKAVKNPLVQKWDEFLPDSLLRKGYGRRRFNVEGAKEVCEEILKSAGNRLGPTRSVGRT